MFVRNLAEEVCTNAPFETLQKANFKEKDGLHEWKGWELKKLEAIVCYIRQHPESIPANYKNKYAYISHHTFGLRISSQAIKTKIEELLVQPSFPEEPRIHNESTVESDSDLSAVDSNAEDSFDSDHI